MKNYIGIIAFLLIFQFNVFSQQSPAVEESPDVDISLEELLNRNLVDMSIEDWVNLDEQELNKLSLYGFLNFNMEKVFNEPTLDENGQTIYESSAVEMGVPGFHIYGGSKLSDKFTVFFNLGQADKKISLVNAWGNWRVSDLFQLRIGRQYRRFGLFNERLDQVPTYTGIEPPELFDNDHLILPRLSLISVHGEKKLNNRATLKYFLTSSNGESGPESNVIPLGWDIRYKKNFILFGASGYFSNIGQQGSQSTVALGEGSPSGGILPWMQEDRYTVIGGFLEARRGVVTMKTGYFLSKHQALRDPAKVVTLAEQGKLNATQIDRMFLSNETTTTFTEADVNTNGDYTVDTWYVRVNYEKTTTVGKFIPYLFMDFYRNPETIGSKSFGGDNEAGVSESGKFYKPSLGIVYKPQEKVAIKLDASSHQYVFNGINESYPEVRLDFSFMFK